MDTYEDLHALKCSETCQVIDTPYVSETSYLIAKLVTGHYRSTCLDRCKIHEKISLNTSEQFIKLQKNACVQV